MKNRKKAKLYGVAVNDANYPVVRHEIVGGKQMIVWRCEFYTRWYGMIRRCYSGNMPKKLAKYNECSVHPDWFLFSNFKSWMEKQDWQGKQLDKDLIVEGNKEYGPETCVFVDAITNTFTEDCGAARGSYLIGSSFSKLHKKFESYCRNPFTKKMERFGLHETSESAHKAWKTRKHELALILADMQADERVAKTLREKYAP